MQELSLLYLYSLALLLYFITDLLIFLLIIKTFFPKTKKEGNVFAGTK
jgi:hypothetical protein